MANDSLKNDSNRTSRGKFIVIDGSDGAGKKTQSDLLIDKLKSEGYKIAYYDFPQYENSFFGKLVGRYLNGEFGEVEDINPYLISLLYAGDRWQASSSIKKDLAEGKVVISNRYMQSNMAFSGARFKKAGEREQFLKWLTELEYEIYQIPKPDLVLYLYVPYAIGQKLVDQKEKRNYTDKKRDIHEKNSVYLKEVESEYLYLSEHLSEWRKVDCVLENALLSKEEISNKIYSLVKKELND